MLLPPAADVELEYRLRSNRSHSNYSLKLVTNNELTGNESLGDDDRGGLVVKLSGHDGLHQGLVNRLILQDGQGRSRYDLLHLGLYLLLDDGGRGCNDLLQLHNRCILYDRGRNVGS